MPVVELTVTMPLSREREREIQWWRQEIPDDQSATPREVALPVKEWNDAKGIVND
jgi:hypothetical protein